VPQVPAADLGFRRLHASAPGAIDLRSVRRGCDATYRITGATPFARDAARYSRRSPLPLAAQRALLFASVHRIETGDM